MKFSLKKNRANFAILEQSSEFYRSSHLNLIEKVVQHVLLKE